MERFIDVAATSDLPVGRARAFSVGDCRVAVCHTAKGYFAVDNTCPHRGGPLGEGDIIGDEIVCPWHLWGFDVGSGRCPGSPDLFVSTYEVRIDEGRILVREP